jgi:hypothetical protein
MNYINNNNSKSQNFSSSDNNEGNKIQDQFISISIKEDNIKDSKKKIINEKYEKNQTENSKSSNLENLDIIDSYNIKNTNNDNNYNLEYKKQINSNRKKKEKEKFLKNLSRGEISIKYLIFIIILFIIFLVSLIVGFILHFDLKLHVTASGIIWTFSFILLCLTIFYSYIYFKIKKAKIIEEKYKLLRYFPM